MTAGNRLGALEPCPCDLGRRYGECCAPFHSGAPTPDPATTMRARYSAYVLGETDFLFRSWHPRTRPDNVRGDASTRWTGLRVLRCEDDVVEFIASFDTGHGPGRIHEVSTFAQRAGRWVYVEAQG